MAEQVEFELVTPEKLLLSENVDMVVIPGGEGDFGVLPGHSPMISTVRPGVVNIYEKDKISQSIFVSGGFAEVGAERCTLLAEKALNVDDIDRNQVEETLAKTRDRLEACEPDSAEAKAAEAEIHVAEAMLAVAGTGGGKGH